MLVLRHLSCSLIVESPTNARIFEQCNGENYSLRHIRSFPICRGVTNHIQHGETSSLNRSHGTVILLGPSLTAVSGVSTHVNQLIGSSLLRGFRLIHFQVGSEGRNETVFGRLLRLVGSPLALAKRIIRVKADAVHVNTSLNHKAFWRDLVYLVIAKWLNCKVVLQIHGGSISSFCRHRSVVSNALRLAARVADSVVVLTAIEEHNYRKIIGRDNVQRIPNGVDMSGFRFPNGKPYQSAIKRLGYLGRIDLQKGLMEAIEAMALLRNDPECSGLQLFLAGAGPAESALRVHIAKLHLNDRVVLVGQIRDEEKCRFLDSADILIFPSYHEGLPYAVLEGLASGTPIITTRVGGIPDIVEEGVHGTLIQPRDVQQLADAIKKLSRDRNLLRWMSLNCVRRTQELYDINRMAQAFSILYVKMIESCKSHEQSSRSQRKP